MAIDWGSVLSTGISTVGKYLISKDQTKLAKAQAKYAAQSGGGMNLDTIVALIQMGQGLARPQTTAPTVTPWTFPATPSTGTSALSLLPQATAPQITPTAPTTPVQYVTTPGGQTMAVSSALYTPTTAPYQQAGITDLIGPILPQVPSLLQGVGGANGGGIIDAPQAFTQYASGYRAKSFFATRNPQTGNLTWFRNVGKPILFSGDLRAAKRVAKVASRARRATPRRRPATRRRR